MKRYLVFAWFDYEAQGGMGDLKGKYIDVHDATSEAYVLLRSYDSVQVYDVLNEEVMLNLLR